MTILEVVDKTIVANKRQYRRQVLLLDPTSVKNTCRIICGKFFYDWFRVFYHPLAEMMLVGSLERIME